MVASHYDWLRPESEYPGECSECDRWREFFENEMDDADLDEERFVELRERYIDRAFDTRRTPEDVEALSERGLRKLVEVLGPENVL